MAFVKFLLARNLLFLIKNGCEYGMHPWIFYDAGEKRSVCLIRCAVFTAQKLKNHTIRSAFPSLCSVHCRHTAACTLPLCHRWNRSSVSVKKKTTLCCHRLTVQCSFLRNVRRAPVFPAHVVEGQTKEVPSFFRRGAHLNSGNGVNLLWGEWPRTRLLPETGIVSKGERSLPAMFQLVALHKWILEKCKWA